MESANPRRCPDELQAAARLRNARPARIRRSAGRLLHGMQRGYAQYEDAWDRLWSLLSRESVLAGSIEQAGRDRRGTLRVDEAFLEELNVWRGRLAADLAERNTDLDRWELTEATQRILDRLVFLRVCEDRTVEQQVVLRRYARVSDAYQHLRTEFRRLDHVYNGALFGEHFSEQLGGLRRRPSAADRSALLPAQPLPLCCHRPRAARRRLRALPGQGDRPRPAPPRHARGQARGPPRRRRLLHPSVDRRRDRRAHRRPAPSRTHPTHSRAASDRGPRLRLRIVPARRARLPHHLARGVLHSAPGHRRRPSLPRVRRHATADQRRQGGDRPPQHLRRRHRPGGRRGRTDEPLPENPRGRDQRHTARTPTAVPGPIPPIAQRERPFGQLPAGAR